MEQQSQPPSSTVKMNGLRSPLTSASAPAYAADKRAESNECFRPRILWYPLISACITLYRHRKFGHPLGAKTVGFVAISNALTSKKVSIYNGF